jgi:polysaccharide chain length determinant protein (PEP-CTERM system associated)
VLLRRFWYVAIPFFLISLIAILYCTYAPRIFKAETFILIERQKVPGEFVASTVTVDMNSRLRTIGRQVRRYTRLEKIIHDYDLYPEIRARATMSDAVGTFAQSIEVTASERQRSFKISYQGKDPQKVMEVTNILANLFIEDNLRLRGEQAAGTTRFLDQEIEKIEQTLKEKDFALRQFKERYLGLLPENMRQNQQMLAHLQQRLDSINATIQRIEDRRILLETQRSDLDRNGAPDLEELQNRLLSLKSRYTDAHPDVVKTEAAIRRLKKELEAERRERTFGRGSQGLGTEVASRDLSTQILAIDTELKNLAQQREKIEAERDIYRRRVEDAPRIEQMLGDLTRDYDEVDKNYSSLIEKRFKANLSENLEIAQKGEQFTILDHAQLPDKPFKPQTGKILLVGLCLALSGGFGLAFLREYYDSSFFSTKELESALQLPVLASIQVIITDADRKRIFFGRYVSAAALLAMASILLCALYFLWQRDPMAVFTTVI